MSDALFTSPTAPRDFVASVVYSFRQSVVFRGRASAREFWWFTLAQGLIEVALAGTMVAFALLGGGGVLAALWALAALVLRVALLVPWISLLVRRAHDLGHSGWWLLVGPASLAFLPALVLLLLRADEVLTLLNGGVTANTLELLALFALLALVVPTLFYFGLFGRRGEATANRYGPPPHDGAR